MVGVSDYDVHNTSLEMSRWPARAEARGNPGVKWTPRKYVALDLTLVGTERQQKIFLFAISVLRGAYCVLLALEDFQTRERERESALQDSSQSDVHPLQRTFELRRRQ